MKLGIEVEFWVVDERGRLTDGTEIVAAHERVEPEFVDPLVEVRTTPHETEASMRRDLQTVLCSALRAAAAAGKKLVPLGTPLTAASSEATGERGRLFEHIYGDGIESAKNCAGTHVHFEKDEVDRQLNVLTALDPAIALVNSSPYYLGDRGADSSRAAAYRGECGEAFERFCGLWPYVDDVEEWEARVVDAYDAYRTLAAERGVPPDRVETHFTPENTVLNPVRLRESVPTVEWRAPDSALPSQVVRLAFDARDLVVRTGEKPLSRVGPDEPTGPGEDAIRIPAFPRLSGLSDDAIRLGLASERVRTYLRSMGFDPSSYDPISTRIRGPETLRESEARDLRLTYAERLCGDVETLTAGSGRGLLRRARLAVDGRS